MSDALNGLQRPDTPVAPRAEFADALLDRCLRELRPRRPRGAVAVLVFAVALIVVGAATATYFATRRGAAPPASTSAGTLTIISFKGQKRLATIAAVVGGRLRTVWHCPHRIWCGELTSIAWSPDGRRLAMTLGEIGAHSGYIGLHVIDVATGADHHVGAPPLAHAERNQTSDVLKRLADANMAQLGCPLPTEVAWSPDSRRLAYSCGDDLLNGGTPTAIYVIRRDGSDRRRLATGTKTAYWPTWSADGTRIAFSTQPSPRLTYQCCSDDPVKHLHGQVYSIRLDGSSRVLVARNAAAPAFSPDGKRIAFETTCGVRVAAVGAPPFDEPTCRTAPTVGQPSWSPDGSTIAVAARQGVLLLAHDGTTLGVAVSRDARGVYGGAAPAWAPTNALTPLVGAGHRAGY